MENGPEIPEIKPSLQELFKGVLDEEYSLFFVCSDEFTAGVVEQAASDSDIGRAELLYMVACEAVEHRVVGPIRTFLNGELAFITGSPSNMLDVTVNKTGPNNTEWYIQLSRPNVVYLYMQESNYPLEQAYSVNVRL